MSGAAPRRVAVTGATGFIGTALSDSLRDEGVQVVASTRAGDRPGTIRWDPAAGRLDPEALRGFDGVVHLAGESINGLWTGAKKRRILASRVEGTRTIAEAAARAPDGPRVLVSISGIGHYGSRGDTLLREEDQPGDDFLARVTVAWEAATAPASRAGIRVAIARTGVVLHPSGGALRLMAPVFRLGLGGPLGDGRQWMSWITLRDAVRALRFALTTPELDGPFNATAPEPVRNADFTRALANAVGRPAFFRVPAFALRTALGEMGETTLLASQRAEPARLLRAGFTFLDPSPAAALERLMGGNA
jgi:uncharacterized protein